MNGLNKAIIEKKEIEKEELFQYIKKEYDRELKNENESIIYFASYYYYSKGKEKRQSFSENSKYITFKNEEKRFDKVYFIHDQASFKFALNESEIRNAILKKNDKNEEEKKMNNYNSNDSKDSKSSSESVDSLDVNEILNKDITIIEQEKSLK